LGHNRAWRTLQGAEIAAGGLADQEANRFNELARAYDVMQIRSFRGSGKPARVIALPSACERLGPDPRRALGPAAIRAASTGRTRDRTRPMLQQRQKVLARAPSTRDPQPSLIVYFRRDAQQRRYTPKRYKVEADKHVIDHLEGR